MLEVHQVMEVHHVLEVHVVLEVHAVLEVHQVLEVQQVPEVLLVLLVYHRMVVVGPYKQDEDYLVEQVDNGLASDCDEVPGVVLRDHHDLYHDLCQSLLCMRADQQVH